MHFKSNRKYTWSSITISDIPKGLEKGEEEVQRSRGPVDHLSVLVLEYL